MDIFEVRHKAHGVSLAIMEGFLGGNNSDNVYVTVPGAISPRDRQGLGPLIFEAFPILVFWRHAVLIHHHGEKARRREGEKVNQSGRVRLRCHHVIGFRLGTKDILTPSGTNRDDANFHVTGERTC